MCNWRQFSDEYKPLNVRDEGIIDGVLVVRWPRINVRCTDDGLPINGARGTIEEITIDVSHKGISGAEVVALYKAALSYYDAPYGWRDQGPIRAPDSSEWIRMQVSPGEGPGDSGQPPFPDPTVVHNYFEALKALYGSSLRWGRKRGEGRIDPTTLIAAYVAWYVGGALHK